MSELAYKIRHRISMFTDRSATQLSAGEVRALLDEYDTTIRLRDRYHEALECIEDGRAFDEDEMKLLARVALGRSDK